MQTVLYSKLGKEACAKSLRESAQQAKKNFLDNPNAYGLIYTELNGDSLRAERFLLLPRIVKPVFTAKLQAEGNLTRISGELGLSPGVKALFRILFAAWAVLGIVISLLSSNDGKIGPFSAGNFVAGLLLAGILLFFVAPRLALRLQKKDEQMILEYLKKNAEVKAVM